MDRKKDNAKTTFLKRYTNEDILLLVKTDTVDQQPRNYLSAPIMYMVMKLMYDWHRSQWPISTIYAKAHFTKTQYTAVNIGERRKPQPNGKQGYIRIDTVHQGDKDKIKEVCHINAVNVFYSVT